MTEPPDRPVLLLDYTSAGMPESFENEQQALEEVARRKLGRSEYNLVSDPSSIDWLTQDDGDDGVPDHLYNPHCDQGCCP